MDHLYENVCCSFIIGKINVDFFLGVREEVASKDWQQMSELICQTPPSNHGFIGFFFDDHEILPKNIQERFYFDVKEQQLDDLKSACKARAVLDRWCFSQY
jgi:hypothetical protein